MVLVYSTELCTMKPRFKIKKEYIRNFLLENSVNNRYPIEYP